MVIAYDKNTKVISITPEDDEGSVFDWIFSRIDGKDLFNFTLKELINQRRNQMNHDEKEAVLALYTKQKADGASVITIDLTKIDNNPLTVEEVTAKENKA